MLLLSLFHQALKGCYEGMQLLLWGLALGSWTRLYLSFVILLRPDPMASVAPTSGDAVGHFVSLCYPGAVCYEVAYGGFIVARRYENNSTSHCNKGLSVDDASVSDSSEPSKGECWQHAVDCGSSGTAAMSCRKDIPGANIWKQMAEAARVATEAAALNLNEKQSKNPLSEPTASLQVDDSLPATHSLDSSSLKDAHSAVPLGGDSTASVARGISSSSGFIVDPASRSSGRRPREKPYGSTIQEEELGSTQPTWSATWSLMHDQEECSSYGVQWMIMDD